MTQVIHGLDKSQWMCEESARDKLMLPSIESFEK
jgi:hypothetical protein